MKLLHKIDFFKIAIVIILLLATYILFNTSKNGRYLSHDTNKIIDTRTGVVYTLQWDENDYLDRPVMITEPLN